MQTQTQFTFGVPARELDNDLYAIILGNIERALDIEKHSEDVLNLA